MPRAYGVAVSNMISMKRGGWGVKGEFKSFSEILEKGVDNWGGVCYYMQVAEGRDKKVLGKTKKGLDKRVGQ